MSVYEVPENDWAAFCRRTSERQRGERVTLRAIDHSRRSEVHLLAEAAELEDLALVGGGRSLALEVQVAGDGCHDRWLIREPQRVRLEQHGELAPARIRVDAEKGTVELCFATPLVPGSLNGTTNEEKRSVRHASHAGKREA